MSSPSTAGPATSIDDGLAIINHVKALKYVDGNRLSVYGVSLGGNLVMHLISRVPVHRAIVGAPAAMWFLGMQSAGEAWRRRRRIAGQEARSGGCPQEHRADHDSRADPGGNG